MAAAAPSSQARSQLLLEAAEIYVDRLDEIDRAVGLLVQARSLAPDDLAIAERLERVYLRQNKLGELVAILEGKPEKTQEDQLALGLLLAEDRDLARASRVFAELLAANPKHVPAQRALEHTLARTERFAELASVLRLQAATFESEGARLGAISELVLIEEHRGIAPPAGAPTATELLRSVAPEEVLLHEAVLRTGLAAETAEEVARVTTSLSILAASTPDPSSASSSFRALPNGRRKRLTNARRRLRRYRLVLEGWRVSHGGTRHPAPAERLGDAEAPVEAAQRSEIWRPTRSCERRSGRAAEGFIARESNVPRPVALRAGARGRSGIGSGQHGLLALAFDSPIWSRRRRFVARSNATR